MSTYNCLILSLYLFNLCIGCKWTVSSGETLNLSSLSGKKLQTVQIDSSGHVIINYNYSVCANSEVCDNVMTMVAQFPIDIPNCFNAGTYDASILPIYSNESGGTWTFTYFGEDDGCSRVWIPTFICDPTINYNISIVTEQPVGSCNYFVEIDTKVYIIHLYIYI